MLHVGTGICRGGSAWGTEEETLAGRCVCKDMTSLHCEVLQSPYLGFLPALEVEEAGALREAAAF